MFVCYSLSLEDAALDTTTTQFACGISFGDADNRCRNEWVCAKKGGGTNVSDTRHSAGNYRRRKP